MSLFSFASDISVESAVIVMAVPSVYTYKQGSRQCIVVDSPLSVCTVVLVN